MRFLAAASDAVLLLPNAVHTRRPDYFLPWQNHPKRESTGTGFVIRDRLIMTNAHVVADQTYVTVKRHGSSTKYTAGASGFGCLYREVYLTLRWESVSRSAWEKEVQQLLRSVARKHTCVVQTWLTPFLQGPCPAI